MLSSVNMWSSCTIRQQRQPSKVNEDFLETCHEPESADTQTGNEPAEVVGEQRELACWASRNLR